MGRKLKSNGDNPKKKEVNARETIKLSLDDLKQSYARSDFEKLLFAHLPHGNKNNLVKTKKFTIDLDQAIEINKLKARILDELKDTVELKWDDERQFDKNAQGSASFDFDLYLHFEDVAGTVNQMKVSDFLGTAAERVEVITNTKGREEFLSTFITNKTFFWMEVCTAPDKARHKLYQLFRACRVLTPAADERIIAVICLNGEWLDTETVIEILRKNTWVQSEAKEKKMDLAVAWTKHRNIYSSVVRIDNEITHIKGDITNMKGDITDINKDITNIKGDITNIKGAVARMEWLFWFVLAVVLVFPVVVVFLVVVVFRHFMDLQQGSLL